MGGVISSVLGTKNKFNAQAPTNGWTAPQGQIQVTDYADAIRRAQAQAAGQGGPAQGTIDRQNALNDQLQAAATGAVPSAAENQLKQTTAANVNNAAGMAASSRGLNPAAAARMAVDAASGANQTAAGQAATLRAGEQATARGQLASSLASTGGTQLAQQQAGTQAEQVAGGLQSAQTLGAEQLEQATKAQNANLQLGAQQINAGVAAQNTNTNAALAGGLMQGAGSALALLAEGGEVPDADLGQKREADLPDVQLPFYRGEAAKVRVRPEGERQAAAGETPTVHDYAHAVMHMRKEQRFAAGGVSGIDIPQMSIPDYSRTLTEAGESMGKGIGKLMSAAQPKTPKTDPLNLMNSPSTSPGEFDAIDSAAGAAESGGGASAAGGGAEVGMGSAGAGDLVPLALAARGGEIPNANEAPNLRADFRAGGHVPGRAKVSGNDLRNDTVPARLSPGEVVESREVTSKPGMKKALLELNDHPERADEFLAALKKTKAPEERGGGYAAVLAKNRKLEARIAALEKRMAEGGEVEAGQGEEKPRPEPKDDEHASGWHVADWINAHLPEFLSARQAVQAHNARLGRAEAAAGAQ